MNLSKSSLVYKELFSEKRRSYENTENTEKNRKVSVLFFKAWIIIFYQ